MKIENKVVLVEKIEEHEFRFEIPNQAPLALGYLALLRCLDKCLQLLQEHKKNLEPKKPEDSPKDENAEKAEESKEEPNG